MMNKRLEYLYKKKLDDTCTEEEYLEFCELIADDRHVAELEKLADATWDDEPVSYTIPGDKAEALFEAVMQKGRDTVAYQKNGLNWYKWAAVLLVMLCAGFILLKFNKKTDVAVAMIEAKATTEHQLIKLADGSTVVLNANSFLKYPKAFGGATREVTLTGEGYFDIKHDALHPFIVNSGKLKVTVLGTAFNIKAYNVDKSITVTVTRGKVSVSDNTKVLGVITPNQQLSFNKEDQNVVQKLVNSTEVIEWQSKDIFLVDLTMQQAAGALEQRFDVKIAFSSEAVKNCRFTGTFIHGEKLSDILKVLCAFNNATYKTTSDGQILISGPGCS